MKARIMNMRVNLDHTKDKINITFSQVTGKITKYDTATIEGDGSYEQDVHGEFTIIYNVETAERFKIGQVVDIVISPAP